METKSLNLLTSARHPRLQSFSAASESENRRDRDSFYWSARRWTRGVLSHSFLQNPRRSLKRGSIWPVRDVCPRNWGKSRSRIRRLSRPIHRDDLVEVFCPICRASCRPGSRETRFRDLVTRFYTIGPFHHEMWKEEKKAILGKKRPL